ncbi:MAG: DUF1501 domain-containing protein [Pseudomonadota bacterium]
MSPMSEFHPSRRNLLAGAAAFTAWASIPTLAVASGGRDPRFMTIVLRGGLDGLAAVAPVGDRHYEEVRDEYAFGAGDHSGIGLDGFFALNPRLPTVAELYKRGEALFVHATHTPYRQRSHFQGQDVLENGTTSSSHHIDGWLGRAIAQLPVDSAMARQGGFAAASSPPLVMRGASNIVTWLPAGLPTASEDTRARLLDLYEHTDPVLAKALSAGLRLEDIAGTEAEITEEVKTGMMEMGAPRGRRQVVAAATAAGRALGADDGARVGFLDVSGFDTHRRQRLVDGRLGRTLGDLDLVIRTFKHALGDAWQDTVVAVVTEFGRTVRMNGASGTDHGAATVAMLLGGAVAGGRIVADWPGLAPEDLYQGRDLLPTTDLRAVLKGALRDHLGLDRATLGTAVFPDTLDLRPMDGLIATGRMRADAG